MKKNRLAYFLVLAFAIFWHVATCSAQLNHAYSRAEAIAKAKAEGKMILTDFGRPTCEDCWGVTNAFWTTNNPSLRQLLRASCIIWEANIDITAEWNPYAAGLNGWALPLVCFVDPNNPLTYFGSRYQGLFTATLFYNSLQKVIKASMPLCVTNLPAGPLNNNAFTVQGMASTNATLVNSVKGVPISRVMWRTSATDAFQPASGTKAWSAPVALAPGDNTFESYVEYTDGRTSWTNRVVLNYGGVAAPDNTAPSLAITSHTDLQTVTGSPITIRGTASDSGSGGSGIASVTVNGAAATGGSAAGSAVANWSRTVNLSNGANTFTVIAADTAGNTITNSIRIILSPAVPDTTAPILAITSHTDLQTVSTSLILLAGTASDSGKGDSGIGLVTVNGTEGNNDTASGSNTANWSLSVSLAEGTNTLAVVAQDGVGNSVTNSVRIIFVAPATDTQPPSLAITSHTNLQLVGSASITLSGTASDAGSGDNGIASVKVNGLLASNGTAAGSGVANWSRVVSLVAGTNTLKVVAADTAGNTSTNVIRVISDTVRPTVSITSPTSGQRWSNTVFTVRGTARDNRGVASVQYRLNSGDWTPASSGNGWTNWTVDVTPVAGTNTIRAYVRDAAGNYSTTNSVSFILVVPPASDRLTVVTTGLGGLSPNYSNALLQVGKTYSVTARPGAGYVFAGWTGTVLGQTTILSDQAKLSFVMVSNLVLQAEFIPNPFIAFKGTYNGLFYPWLPGNTNLVEATNSGALALTLSTNGSFSGSLNLKGTSLPLSGKLNVALQAQVQVARLGKPSLLLNLQLHDQYNNPSTLNTDTNVVTGTVQDSTNWVSDVLAYRNASGNSNSAAGAYTLVVLGCLNNGTCFGGSTNVPWGDGAGSVRITSAGSVSISGTLADGSSISRSVKVLEEGFCPVCIPLYSGKGLMIGWMNLDTGSTWQLYWIMPPGLTNTFYVDGLAQIRSAKLTRYVAPALGHNSTTWSQALFEVRENNWSTPYTNQVTLTNNILHSLGGNLSNLSMTITAGSGLFSGRFTDPVTLRTLTFKGAVVQDPTPDFPAAAGWFLGPNRQGGIVRLIPE